MSEAKSGADASRQNYFVLGIVPRDRDLAKANPNHSPSFFIDEKSLVVGVRALAMAAVNQFAAASLERAIA